MGIGFAATWLRQVRPPASYDHFNHCVYSPMEYSIRGYFSGSMRDACPKNLRHLCTCLMIFTLSPKATDVHFGLPLKTCVCVRCSRFGERNFGTAGVWNSLSLRLPGLDISCDHFMTLLKT